MKNRASNSDNPEPNFTAWSERVERYIVRVIVVLTVLLCLSQLMLQFPSVRRLISSTERTEGVPFPYISP
ncbi:MAG: DUF5359 family protein [Candidatus Cohnella colombiensis]|uniref:DUF5359 family protein n=1 Tax=Candidatus Cohnella colombiensis TaxID=3121368 RepID=A0AA95EZR7_9BACL|nr:MAG: DUF5359 family protein [Cohnella sp.]